MGSREQGSHGDSNTGSRELEDFQPRPLRVPSPQYIQSTPLRAQLSQAAYGSPCMGRSQWLQLEYVTGAMYQDAGLVMWLEHLQFLPHFSVLLFITRLKGAGSTCQWDGSLRRQDPVGIMLYFEIKWEIKVSPLAKLARLPGRGVTRKAWHWGENSAGSNCAMDQVNWAPQTEAR